MFDLHRNHAYYYLLRIGSVTLFSRPSLMRSRPLTSAGDTGTADPCGNCPRRSYEAILPAAGGGGGHLEIEKPSFGAAKFVRAHKGLSSGGGVRAAAVFFPFAAAAVLLWLLSGRATTSDAGGRLNRNRSARALLESVVLVESVALVIAGPVEFVARRSRR